jgi:hypothetical protein
VGFLNKEEVIEKLCAAVEKRLGEGDSSRRFTLQTLLPGAKSIETAVGEDEGTPPSWLMVGKKAVQQSPCSNGSTDTDNYDNVCDAGECSGDTT